MIAFFSNLKNLAFLVMCLQWAYHLGAYGHDKLGILGAVIGVLASPAVIAVAPFSAWMLMDKAQAIWFYSLLAMCLLGAGITWAMRRRIYDEHGRQI